MNEPAPRDDELRALLLGELSPGDEKRLEEHLSASEELRDRLEALSGATTFKREFETGTPRDDNGVTASVARLMERLKDGAGDPAEPAPATLDAYLDFLQPSDTAGSKGRLGAYEIEDVIAAGGMGVVFKARDPGLDRTVAIKLLSPAFAGNANARERFLREAGAIAAIDHPNVIPIYAVDASTSSLPFLVMKFVDGETLDDRLQPEDPLPLDEILEIGSAVAAALAAAHDQAIIHRDIKPSNILLENGGRRSAVAGAPSESHSPSLKTQIYLTDFGLARIVEGSNPGLTQTGAFLGTPQFMSPEQAEGSDDLDARSDLFSLGALLYTMATGRLPFPGKNFAELSESIREQAPVPPHEHNPELPVWLANLINRLLAKDPANRPATSAEVAAAIDERRDPGTVATALLTGRRARRHRLLKRLAAAATLIFFLIAGTLLATEQSGRTALVNALLCARSGNSFYHAGDWGTFDSLTAAIDSARPGAVIIVRSNDELPTGIIRIEDPEKALTIRASDGFRPILTDHGAGAIALIGSYAPLSIEGIEIRQSNVRVGGDPAPVFALEGASFRLVNCRILRPLRKPTETPVSKIACIALTNCRSLEIINSEIHSISRPTVYFGPVSGDLGDSRIVIENSVLLGPLLHFRASGEQTSHVVLRRNLNVSSIGIEFRGRGTAPGQETLCTVVAENNVVHAFEDWITGGPSNSDRMRTLVDWGGDENVYIVGGRFISASTVEEELVDLESWRTFWAGDRPDSVPDLESTFLGEPFVEVNHGEIRKRLEPFQLELPADRFERLPDAGPDYSLVGPGEAFQRARR